MRMCLDLTPQMASPIIQLPRFREDASGRVVKHWIPLGISHWISCFPNLSIPPNLNANGFLIASGLQLSSLAPTSMLAAGGLCCLTQADGDRSGARTATGRHQVLT